MAADNVTYKVDLSHLDETVAKVEALYRFERAATLCQRTSGYTYGTDSATRTRWEPHVRPNTWPMSSAARPAASTGVELTMTDPSGHRPGPW